MNLYKAFRNLLPKDRVLSGEVVTVHSDGTSTLELPGGNQVRVQGDSIAVGDRAYVQGGRIIGEAPNLTIYNETV